MSNDTLALRTEIKKKFTKIRQLLRNLEDNLDCAVTEEHCYSLREQTHNAYNILLYAEQALITSTETTGE